MKYTIKRDNTLLAEVQPTGQVTERIMGEDLVDMQFSLPHKVEFYLNDTVEIFGRKYLLHQSPICEKVSSRHFNYALQFAGLKYYLARWLMLFPNADNNLTLTEYSITGTARQIIGIIVQNANREMPTWNIGKIDTEETKSVTFDGDSCLSALAKTADAFNIEYWVDDDKTICLEERKKVSGYSFQYGLNCGLRGISRTPLENANIVTRLYPLGSDKNSRNGKRLTIDSVFVEKNTDKFGVIEARKKFDEVFPHRLGTVTAVHTDPCSFTDSGMDFDLNAVDSSGNTTILINNVSAKVTFNSGQLAGYTFEIEENGYNSATKTFRLLQNEDEALTVPNKLLRPKVGDKYVITNIIMPKSYEDNAKEELRQKANNYLKINSRPRFIYNLPADPSYFKALNINIKIGDTCRFTDSDFDLDDDLRIIAVTRDLQNPYNVEFELSESAVVIQIVREYFKLEKNKNTIYKFLQDNADIAKKSYEFAKETYNKTFDQEGYFDPNKIKPLSIETKMLQVGSRLQQFVMPDVVLTITNNNTAISNTGGEFTHLTIEDENRTWNIAANSQMNLSENYHYLYVKADKNGTNANIFASENKYLIDNDPDFYYFEIGELSSIRDNFRRIKTKQGFTSVSPGEIATGRISSPLGNNFIDIKEDGIDIRANRFSIESNGKHYRVPADKGIWEAGTYNYYDRVSHNGSLWLCVAQPNTTEEPGDNSTAWQKQVAKGGSVVNIVKNGMFSDGFDHWEIKKRLNGEGEVTSEGFVPDFAQGVKFINIALVQRRGFVKMHGKYIISFMLGQRIKHITRISISVFGSDLTNKDVYCDWEGLRMVSFSFNYERPFKFFYLVIGWENGVEAFITDVRITKMDESIALLDEKMKGELLTTGIDINNKEIALIADRTSILSRNGEKIAMFTSENEKPLLLAENIKFEGAATQSGKLKILNDGSIEATDGVFKGHIEANSGTFKGTIEAQNGKFGSFEIANNGFVRMTGKGTANAIISTFTPTQISMGEYDWTSENHPIPKETITISLRGISVYKKGVGARTFGFFPGSNSSGIENY